MTREEIKNTPELVDFMLDKSITADSRMKLRKRLEELCKLAIKALEQEPFINKPCVSSGVCEHDKQEVLNKIRAEIAEYGSIMVSYAITKDTKTDKGIEKLVSDVLKEAKEQVLEIIDKYKAESEK